MAVWVHPASAPAGLKGVPLTSARWHLRVQAVSRCSCPCGARPQLVARWLLECLGGPASAAAGLGCVQQLQHCPACLPLQPAADRCLPARPPRPPCLQPAEQLRPIWRSLHEQHSYPEFNPEWKRAVLIFSCASRAHLAPPPPQPDACSVGSAERIGSSGGAATGSAGAPQPAASAGSASPAPPHPQDSSAMLVD